MEQLDLFAVFGVPKEVLDTPMMQKVTEYLDRHMNPPEPPCYTCTHAVKRGNFRLCKVGGHGYKHIGEWIACEKWEQEERNTSEITKVSSRP